MLDEYLSVPEYYGPLPSGEVVALGSNPTLVERLTGADRRGVRSSRPSRRPRPTSSHRRTRSSAGSPHAMGIEGADHGYAQAREVSGAIVIDR